MTVASPKGVCVWEPAPHCVAADGGSWQQESLSETTLLELPFYHAEAETFQFPMKFKTQAYKNQSLTRKVQASPQARPPS